MDSAVSVLYRLDQATYCLFRQDTGGAQSATVKAVLSVVALLTFTSANLYTLVPTNALLITIGIIAIAAVTSTVILTKHIVPGYWRQEYNKSESAIFETHYQISAWGLQTQHVHGGTRYAWGDLNRFSETAHLFLFYTTPRQAVILPKSILDETQIANIKRYATQAAIPLN